MIKITVDNRYTKDLFLKLVHEDANFRYTVEQVQDHPWMTRRFNEDIPLTSSEKIAAFSHSQILSGVTKTILLNPLSNNKNRLSKACI